MSIHSHRLSPWINTLRGWYERGHRRVAICVPDVWTEPKLTAPRNRARAPVTDVRAEDDIWVEELRSVALEAADKPRQCIHERLQAFALLVGTDAVCGNRRQV